jgi:hypothetical protein
VQSPPVFVPEVPVLPLDVPPVDPLLLVSPLLVDPLLVDPEDDVAPASAGMFVVESLPLHARKRTKRPATKDPVRRTRMFLKGVSGLVIETKLADEPTISTLK